ncbi:MAG TPA: hypothetical protein VHP14_02225 [Anaerolineales bacterium]|nr:hypothetical protein [Anaerolineales bacterium]
MQLLIRRENIFDPLLSDDGQWLVFQQRHNHPNGSISMVEVWATRTDGTELHRLIGSDDLNFLVNDETAHFIHQIAWVPGRHELLFNTEKVIEGPPERWPVFDLFLLDLSGKVIRLAKAGQGGKFFPSPDGSYVAVASSSRIRILDLKNGGQRASLKFDPVGLGCECVYIPEIAWDPGSQFILTAIAPQNLYYPETYNDELERVWRLSSNGRVDLVSQFQPLALGEGIKTAPTAQYFFYLSTSCPDAMGMLHVYNLASGEATPLFCVWNLPHWVPDGEHFIYNWDLVWRFGSIFESTGADRPLDLLNAFPDTNSQLTWMDTEYFLLRSRNKDTCTLSIASLEGIIKEIVRTTSDVCPGFDFNLSD